MIFKNSPIRFRFADGRKLYTIGLGMILLGRILIHILLYQSGFNVLTADDFGRIIIAAHWARSPEPMLGGYWLPFHTYLFGALFWMIWDLLWTPRIVAIIFGLVSIVVMFLLTEELTHNRRLGVIAAILLAINPAHIWLSSTPLPRGNPFHLSTCGLILFDLTLKGWNSLLPLRRWTAVLFCKWSSVRSLDHGAGLFAHLGNHTWLPLQK